MCRPLTTLGDVPAAQHGDLPPARNRTTRRGAVSADVPDVDMEGEIKVIPKSAAVMASLMKSVSSNILFQHLENDELNGVLDAMFEVNAQAGEAIIQQVCGTHSRCSHINAYIKLA